ncbi:hypothetical protein GCM10010264_30290 [Streptomyces globisporus]|nr:hypothetical protein GCM10010264_30290 [Streptomyces globisporus]
MNRRTIREPVFCEPAFRVTREVSWGGWGRPYAVGPGTYVPNRAFASSVMDSTNGALAPIPNPHAKIGQGVRGGLLLSK